MDKTLFFEFYYNQAEVNAIVIMDTEGTVLDVNQAFTKNFGYHKEDIAGMNFDVLYVQRDKEKSMPQHELETVMARGQANDECYVVDSQGRAVWCTGESLLVKNQVGEKYIVKDLVNLQAKKQLQLFLKGTDELLERIFDSSRDIPIMVLDASMKVEKVNRAFLHLFELAEAPQSGCRLSDLDHGYWKNEGIKNDLRRILVTNQPIKEEDYALTTKRGELKKIRIDSRIIEKQGNNGRQIFIILDDLPVEA